MTHMKIAADAMLSLSYVLGHSSQYSPQGAANIMPSDSFMARSHAVAWK
jgi:hypothetical protein